MVRLRHVAALVLLLAAASPASAQPQDQPDRYERMPREMEDVGLTEHLGATVPLDLPFTGEDGAPITLRQVMARGLPVVLTFNYSDCPVLCSTQLDMLTKALAKLPDTPGALPVWPGVQYQIVTVALDPTQGTEKSRRMRDTYVKGFPAERAAGVRAGWHFVTGPESSVRMLADAVGIHYRYLADKKQYVHPALVTFLSSEGMIVRYLKGLDYAPIVISESIWAAGTSSPRDSVGFVLTCFHYDGKDTAGLGRKAMKYGAAGFVVLLLVGFAAWHHVRSRRGRKESSPA
jgi:protein SCO1